MLALGDRGNSIREAPEMKLGESENKGTGVPEEGRMLFTTGLGLFVAWIAGCRGSKIHFGAGILGHP